jgi:hypothetical protein
MISLNCDVLSVILKQVLFHNLRVYHYDLLNFMAILSFYFVKFL